MCNLRSPLVGMEKGTKINGDIFEDWLSKKSYGKAREKSAML